MPRLTMFVIVSSLRVDASVAFSRRLGRAPGRGGTHSSLDASRPSFRCNQPQAPSRRAVAARSCHPPGSGWIDGMWCMPAPSRGLLWQHIAGPWILAVSSPLPGVAGHSWLAVHPPAGVATSATDRPSGESCRRPAPPRPPRNARSRQPSALPAPTQPSYRPKRHVSCRLLSHPRPLPCPRVAIDQATTGGVSRYRYIVREPLAA